MNTYVVVVVVDVGEVVLDLHQIRIHMTILHDEELEVNVDVLPTNMVVVLPTPPVP